MKRFQKREILHIISLIRKLHNAIADNVKRKKYDVAFELLLECQRSAIDTGTAAEETEGPDAEAVAAFKNYCEEVCRISEALHMTDAEEISERLNRSLQAVEDQFKKLDCGKLEAVFFPYKASMWDSLESIWEAAEKDEDVEAFVAPIPYFEKNPDGTLGEMHDESGLYPDYVPVYSWEDYRVQERRPDIIFIHNPYDNANRVTSVHPAFYASVLHQYTDMLVYVPYFTVIDDVAENFCVLPGTVFADRVILQSERIRDSYIRHFGKWVSDVNGEKKSRQQQLTGWEEKFVALGSPKLDRINRTERKDTLLPEQWKQKIYGTDGVRRKIVLYNTGVTALLNHEDIFEKISSVFETFKGRRKVVLWWRPHPLYENTLASMQPYRLEQFRKLVRRYQQEDFGIYDDTADIDHAVAQSDVYYGDRSSLVTLYEECGKPVLIQNLSERGNAAKENSGRIPVYPSAFCVDGDDIWLVHRRINLLLRYRIAEKKTYAVGTVPGEKFFQGELYSDIHRYKDRLFLIPRWGKKIAVYDLKKQKFTVLPFAVPEKYQNRQLFCKSFPYGKFLYCIPYYYDRIVKIDMAKLTIDNCVIWNDTPQEKSSGQKLQINDAAQIDENRFAAVLTFTNVILIYDMSKDCMEWRAVGDRGYGYTAVASIGQKLYLYDGDNSNKVIKHELSTGETEEEPFILPFCHAKLNSTGTGYLVASAAYDGSFILIDEQGKFLYEKKGGEEEEKKPGDGTLDFIYWLGLCRKAYRREKMFYYFDETHYMMYCFFNKEAVEKFQLYIDDTEMSKIKNTVKQIEDNFLPENEINTLDVWLENIEYRITKARKNIKNSGKEVLENILNEVKRMNDT